MKTLLTINEQQQPGSAGMRTLLEINGETYLLRSGARPETFFDLMQGARRVRPEHLADYTRRVLVDHGEVEIGIRLRPASDELMTADEYQAENDRERKERRRKEVA